MKKATIVGFLLTAAVCVVTMAIVWRVPALTNSVFPTGGTSA